MQERKRRLATWLGLPVLAICGFAVAAVMASVGIATGTTTGTTTTETTTTTTTTTTPEGGEGCTPGFWKQDQHFDSYPAGITPTTTLASVGFVGTGSTTFLTALSTGGGGLDALLRHAAAAYLNAASTGVDFDLSTSDVVSMTNAAILSGDYETTKDEFEELNEQGCPLS
jgi:hypothetical protein